MKPQGIPEFRRRTRLKSRVSGNSKADFYDLLGVDTKNWFDLGCHMTAGMARALCFAAPQRYVREAITL
jgi:hypothetical protein